MNKPVPTLFSTLVPMRPFFSFLSNLHPSLLFPSLTPSPRLTSERKVSSASSKLLLCRLVCVSILRSPGDRLPPPLPSPFSCSHGEGPDSCVPGRVEVAVAISVDAASSVHGNTFLYSNEFMIIWEPY